MYSRCMLAIVLLSLFTLNVYSAQPAIYQAEDGFCSFPGWSVLPWQEQVKIDNWTVHLEGIGVASAACQNEHPAFLTIFDENNQSMGPRGSVSICPNQNLTLTRASDGKSIDLKVGKTAIGISPSAEWIEIFGTARNCSVEYADAGFTTPLQSPTALPFAAGDAYSTTVVGNGSQIGATPNILIVTSPPPASGQLPPSNEPVGQLPAPIVTITSTPPALPSGEIVPTISPDAVPPTSPPPKSPASDSSSPSTSTYANAKTGGELTSTPPSFQSAQSSQPSGASWPWWMAPAIVAALGAFFMGVMAFYYRQPSVLGPFQTPSAPAPEAEPVPPVYLSTTRIALMEQLADTERIPTDIAIRLKKSKSTVVEQLDDLCASGLVERISTPGKKFVFYRLSRSGRLALVHSPDAKKKPSLLPF